MNPTNMNLLADYVEANPGAHYQGSWKRCLAGLCCILDGSKESVYEDSPLIEDGDEAQHGKDFLDLNNVEVYRLFGGGWQPQHGRSIPDQLRRYASGEDDIIPPTVEPSKVKITRERSWRIEENGVTSFMPSCFAHAPIGRLRLPVMTAPAPEPELVEV